MQLTTASLKHELAAWGPNNRNKDDQRFGQYLCNNYTHVPDQVWNWEDKYEVYNYLVDKLADYHR